MVAEMAIFFVARARYAITRNPSSRRKETLGGPRVCATRIEDDGSLPAVTRHPRLESTNQLWLYSTERYVEIVEIVENFLKISIHFR